MSTDSSPTTMPDKDWLKQMGRRRVFGFFWVFFVLAIAQTLSEESDQFFHVLDNYVDIALAAVAIIALLVWWKKTSTKDLKMLNNLLTVLAVLLVLATLFAFSQEIGDSQDLADDIPTLFFGVFMLINRFV